MGRGKGRERRLGRGKVRETQIGAGKRGEKRANSIGPYSCGSNACAIACIPSRASFPRSTWPTAQRSRGRRAAFQTPCQSRPFRSTPGAPCQSPSGGLECLCAQPGKRRKQSEGGGLDGCPEINILNGKHVLFTCCLKALASSVSCLTDCSNSLKVSSTRSNSSSCVSKTKAGTQTLLTI